MGVEEIVDYNPSEIQISDYINAILNSAHNGIIAVDKNGCVTIINPAAEKMIGIKARDGIGRHITDIIPTTNLLEVLETGEPMFNQKFEMNGKMFITNRTPIKKNGKIVGAVGIFQDISELESISNELKCFKELSNELNAIIESSYDGIYVTNGSGITLRVNSAYERISGIKREEVIGRHMKDLEDKGFYSQSVTLLVLDKKRPITIMQRIKGKKDVIVTGNPIFDEKGNIFRVVTNVRDITELNYLKNELEKTKRLTQKYHDELSELRLQHVKLNSIIANSKSFKHALALALRAAKVDSNVLITGESGVGKEVIARVIHNESERRKGPFIKINCGAIPENLLESELFGYEGGAFSGAKKEGKPGLFEVAEGGTLLLDEIADMTLNLQVKLLRVIQEKEIMRVGGIRLKKINVRIISSTNRDLKELVQEGKFREDLFYRLNVIPIYVAPLRERKEDIIPLIYYFLKQLNEKYGFKKSLSPEVIDRLSEYHWPGNVRELENIIERIVVLSEDDNIGIRYLPPFLRNEEDHFRTDIVVKDTLPLKKVLEKVECQMIFNALQKYKNVEKAAKALGVHRTTIIRKKQKFNI